MHRFFRHIPLCLALAAATACGAETIVRTELVQDETVSLRQGDTLQVNLANFFVENRPIANFTLRMPVEAGIREVFYGAELSRNMMTYELVGGGTYDDFFAVSPQTFVWNNQTLRFQLLRDIAPVTVQNFLGYANPGIYTNTVIHRSTISVLQGGGWIHRLDETEEFFPYRYLAQIGTTPPIPLERTWNNIQGTLAMARTAAENSATSQFFINVEDNTAGFGNNYAVFGDLLDKETSLPLLKQLETVAIWNLGGAFATVPFYSGKWEDADSWIHFDAITISDGTPGAVVESWAFLDPNGDGEFTPRELANQAVFNISIVDGRLNVTREDSGEARIRITARAGSQTADFTLNLTGYNPEALEAFPGATIFQRGFIESDWYGFLVAEDYPLLQHLNHGYQYAIEASPGSFYIYDYLMDSWLFLNEATYPHLFSYSRNTWMWYVSGTGDGVSASRYFYNYAAGDYFLY
jgi:cyclophilin family peptidyl-prolyl cis-trans isomerase